MQPEFISIHHLEEFPSLSPFCIRPGELSVIRGNNGSGKTRLGKILAGKLWNPANKIEWKEGLSMYFSSYTADSVSFTYSSYYYQQRYNAFDRTEVRTVGAFMGYDPSVGRHAELLSLLLSEAILTRRLTDISSGETRKALLLKNLFHEADAYILDQPLIGLDVASLKKVNLIFSRLVEKYGKSLVILSDKIPEGIQPDLLIELPDKPLTFSRQTPGIKASSDHFDIAFSIEDQSLRAGDNTLIRDLTWTIRKGEKWLLKGANGSGKSTLMSLLNADNPMAYGMKVILFDRQRGTGESIWEIKRRIGFISPEIQLYWGPGVNVRRIIHSGVTCTMYPSRRLTGQELTRAGRMAGRFGLSGILDKTFGELSTGEKRLVVIARALFGNPPLLILDEPFQGLDEDHFQWIHGIFRKYADPGRTIIQITHLDREILPEVDHLAVIRDRRLLTGLYTGT